MRGNDEKRLQRKIFGEWMKQKEGQPKNSVNKLGYLRLK